MNSTTDLVLIPLWWCCFLLIVHKYFNCRNVLIFIFGDIPCHTYAKEAFRNNKDQVWLVSEENGMFLLG